MSTVTTLGFQTFVNSNTHSNPNFSGTVKPVSSNGAIPQIFTHNIQLTLPQPEDTQDIKTEDLVEKINTLRVGIEHNKRIKEAREYLQTLRELGGLIVSQTNQPVNVPLALEQLTILSGIKATVAPDLKMEILDTLIALLRRDNPEKKELAVGLVDLAIKMTKKLDDELVQTEVIDVQIKIALAYHEVLKNILSHYNQNGHINAIKDTLKAQLFTTNGNLDALNTQNDPDLSYAIECVQEAIKRIRSNENKLKSYFIRIGSALQGLADLYNTNIKSAAENLWKAVDGLDQEVKFPWYGTVQAFGFLGKSAKSDVKYLIRLQEVYLDKTFNGYLSKDWKCTYAYVDNLFEVVQYGQSTDIRSKAVDLLAALADCNTYKDEKAILRSAKQLKNLKPIEINL